jgi:hypothetical protein
MNDAPPDSHVGEVERSVRTIKDRLRTGVHGLPFKRLPKIMVRHMVTDATRCLNQFPRKNGISATMSPATIVTGVGTPDYHRMKLEFGAYVQVFEDSEPTNTPRARSMGAIALCPTGNSQGDYYFMSLATGARIARHRWTELPITDTAIARVEALAIADDMPLLQERGLVVEWRPGQPIDDEEYDADYHLPNQPPADDFAPGDYDPLDADELAALHEPHLDLDDALHLQDQGALDVNVPIQHDAVSDHGEDDDHDVDYYAAEPYGPDVAHTDNDTLDQDEHGDDGENDAYDDDRTNNPADDGEEDDIHNVPEYDDPDANFPEAEGAHPGAAEQQAATHTYNLRDRAPRTDPFRTAIDEPHSATSYFPPGHQFHQITMIHKCHVGSMIYR